jgi:hypothetical protein
VGYAANWLVDSLVSSLLNQVSERFQKAGTMTNIPCVNKHTYSMVFIFQIQDSLSLCLAVTSFSSCFILLYSIRVQNSYVLGDKCGLEFSPERNHCAGKSFSFHSSIRRISHLHLPLSPLKSINAAT